MDASTSAQIQALEAALGGPMVRAASTISIKVVQAYYYVFCFYIFLRQDKTKVYCDTGPPYTCII